ncbi:MAG: biopolymer transporter ExbD [Gemmatimonadales bacterium]|nr:biopolymer transporter ExbD [Gemmatimonadales bacterium]
MAGLGGIGRRRRRRTLNAEVNIINLVDVVLVLLIIFMVTAPMMQGGVEVRLPKAATTPISNREALTISVTKDGQVAIEDQLLSVRDFRAMLPGVVARKSPKAIYIRADADGRTEDLLRVLGIVRGTGVASVGLVAEPEGR